MTEEILERYRRDTIELVIEESIQEVFSEWKEMRDEMYGRNDVFNKKVAAILLTGLYLEYGCDSEDLALELLLFDVRNRDEGQYPGFYCSTIKDLWVEYNNLKTSPFHEGEIFRTRQKKCKQLIDRKLEFFRSKILF